MQNQITDIQAVEKEKHTCEHTTIINNLNSIVN